MAKAKIKVTKSIVLELSIDEAAFVRLIAYKYLSDTSNKKFIDMCYSIHDEIDEALGKTGEQVSEAFHG